jgi:hypothetical protein
MRTCFRYLCWAALVTCACAPEIEILGDRTSHDPAEEPPADVAPQFSVALEPRAPLEAAPRVLRLHIGSATGEALVADAFHLFRGEISPRQASHVDSKPLSKTLAARAVPVERWSEADGVIIAPIVALDPGGVYSLVGRRQLLGVVRVLADDEVPLLRLAWPYQGRSPTGLLAVWCGDRELQPTAASASLDPVAVSGVIRSGVSPSDGARRCLHFEPAAGATASTRPAVPPPLVMGNDGRPAARLEPIPLSRDETPVPVEPPLVCATGTGTFGPGCARVEDDRLLLETPGTELLWSVQSPKPVGLERVWPSDGGPVYLWPLPPASKVALTVTTIDRAGTTKTALVSVTTKPPMSHLVLTEVMANPIGPEPQQEWVELYNDGLAPAPLSGLRIADIDGEALLPEVVIPPGGYALIVNESYDEGGKHDPPPAPGCAIVRVPKLAKDGLGNDGEIVELVDAAGKVVSHFPAINTKAGRSAYRAEPKSLSQFALSEVGSSTPCASNAKAGTRK